MLSFEISPYKGAEMLPYERFKLFNWISTFKPRGILEVGTGGGGGTSYMAEAIRLTRFKCPIYTCDPNRKPSPRLFRNYPFIEFFRQKSDIMIQEIIDRNVQIDFIFFDGPEDSEVALRDIKTLETWIVSGTHFCMHDWEYKQRYFDGGISIKAKSIRPYMEKSKNWEKVEVLNGLKRSEDNRKESVGLCLYKFVK